MVNNEKSKKCIYSSVILILLIVFISNLAYAQSQNETNQEVKETKPWFSGVIEFLKSLFRTFFQIDANELKNVTENQNIINKSEETNNTESGDIINISSATCGSCQYLVNDTCLNYSCCSGGDCKVNEYCSEHECVNLSCGSCQYIENYSCINYECCEDEDCSGGKVCINRKCQSESSPTEQPINFETVQQGIAEYTGYTGNACLVESEHQTGDNLTCVSVITNDTDLENLRVRIKQYSVDPFLDFDNYILIAVSYRGEAPFIEIKDIRQIENDIKIYFYIWWGSPEKTGAETTLHIVKIKKLDLMPKQNIKFIFTGNETYGSSIGQWKVENIIV